MRAFILFINNVFYKSDGMNGNSATYDLNKWHLNKIKYIQ